MSPTNAPPEISEEVHAGRGAGHSYRHRWARFRVRMGEGWGAVAKFARENRLDLFPLREALRGYRFKWLKADIRGGLDGALLAIPQGLAFALIAGLPLAYGITCSAVACIVGAMLASSRHSIYGPTNATAFMVASYFGANPQINQIEAMPMLVFLVGVLLMAGAYFRVADIAQYISRTVIVAYLAGAAVQMCVHQFPVVLGIELSKSPGEKAAHTLFTEFLNTLGNLRNSKAPAVIVFSITLVSYLAIKRWKPSWPALVITLVSASLVGLGLNHIGWQVATFSNKTFTVHDLLPPFPDFTSEEAGAHFSQLFSLAVSLAFLAMLENSSMARTLAGRSGHSVDANQDMFSLGAANLACSYLSGMPCSHSLTRSLVNFNSGAATPLSVIFSGVFCLVGAITMGTLVGYIPRAALATVVICVSATLLHPKQIRIALRATKSDAFVFLLTFLATLLVPLHVAIFSGIGLSVILYLRKASRPSLVEYEFNPEGNLAEAPNARRQHPSISIVHVEGELFFGAAELFRTQIQRACADPNLRIIILRLKNARHLDATSVMALEELIKHLRDAGRDVIISGAMRDVYRVLRDSGVLDTLGKANFFPGNAANPNISTRNALRRAQEILGVENPEIHIYFDPNKKTAAGA
jgi:SulP family sulfate permease